jgi:hypothetical protein
MTFVGQDSQDFSGLTNNPVHPGNLVNPVKDL